ncbi:HesB/IscA family protein [Marinimicrobium alkaliphilum]|uniref:HesB/IscA family protein n=1 Tax=Marinimicrobium alkaliphilum TaxID=2202654 RepID=UPI000DBA19D3|nr:iron-sulfur cluster assembly accessory protein [Marinimicrobium alkaliphilum]
MAVASFDPKLQAVSVTPAAVAHFRSQVRNHDSASAVRLSVKESGCTGFMYVIDLVDEPQADDLHLKLDDDLELLIDNSSLSVVNGTEIDFVTEGVNRQIKFLNPNAKDYCGCGESFNVSES